MTSAGRVNQPNRYHLPVPSGDTLLGIDLRVTDANGTEPFGNPVIIMLEPVGNQHRFPVRRFDEILQGVKLSAMDGHHAAVIGVYRSITHLGEFSRQGSRIARRYLPSGKRKD